MLFSFYDSKTSKPCASQSYSSGAMRGLRNGIGGINNMSEFVTIMVWRGVEGGGF